MDAGMLRRGAVIGLLGLVAAALAVFLYHGWPGMNLWWPGCTFYRATGWYCPGCGMSRALRALMHRRYAAAFGYNPLMMTVLPAVVLGMGLEVLAWVRGPGRRTPRLRVGPRVVIGFVVVVVAYWVLRNLPWRPFTLLAP